MRACGGTSRLAVRHEPQHQPLDLIAADRLEPGVNLRKVDGIKDLFAQLILLFRGKLLEQGQEVFCCLGKSFGELAEQHSASTTGKF